MYSRPRAEIVKVIKTQKNGLTDRDVPSSGQAPWPSPAMTGQALPPSPAIAAEILAHRLGARAILIVGECDERLIRELACFDVSIRVRDETDRLHAMVPPPASGTFDLALCTMDFGRMGRDEALGVVGEITSAGPRVLLAPWWVNGAGLDAAAINHALNLFAERGFAPIIDREAFALNAVCLERTGVAGSSVVGDFIAYLLAREQAFQSLVEDRRDRLARIASDETKLKTMSAQLRASEAALRSRDEAHRMKWVKRFPLGIQLLWVRLTNRITAIRRRHLELAKDIRSTGLFDEAFYRAQNPYVIEINFDPALHFALIGWKMDRRPNPFFAPLFYSTQIKGGIRAENPLLHFARAGWKQGMRPSPEFNPTAYLERIGLVDADVNPLLHYLTNEYPLDPNVLCGDTTGSKDAARFIPEILEAHRTRTRLPVYFDEKGEPSVCVVLDSVIRSVIFDRSGTAIVVGSLIAKRLHAKLRIVTLGVSFDPSLFGQILDAHSISHHGGVDFVHIPADGSRSLAVTSGDKIVTNSWESTRAALGALPAEKILYLVQENERSSCVSSDEGLLCDETLSQPNVQFLVQTRLLLQELVAGGRSGHFASRAHAFEPAPSNIRAAKDLTERGLRNFVFYADPHDQRNLYCRGLEAIQAAICEGTLAPQHWKFHFIGRQLEDVVLPGGVRPAFYDGSDYAVYSALVGSADLGLCLADGPGPSRLVLDLAAGGAVLVASDWWRNASYRCRNILPTSLDLAAVCATLGRGMALARDLKTRSSNRSEADQGRRAWDEELMAALEGLQIGMH